MITAQHFETHLIDRLPPVRGRVSANAPLAQRTWFRVGGPAEVLFKPADRQDLIDFMASCPQDVPLTVIGVASNLLVRDGGVPGVTIMLGGEFAKISLSQGERGGGGPQGWGGEGTFTDPIPSPAHSSNGRPLPQGEANFIFSGAATLDANLAQYAADHGIAGLEFLCGIPGTIGGAVFMNAGCYGAEIADVLIDATILYRDGSVATVFRDRLGLSYRHSALPEGSIVLEARFQGHKGDRATIAARMSEIKTAREDSQPIRSRTGGSTFANPDGHKAWQLIEQAGCRGLTIGGAQISEKHCNFMINAGDATAADLEALGEEVRRRVKDHSGIDLRWEIKRIGVEA